MKPKILVTARFCMNGDNKAFQVNQNYINKIKEAGGIPIIVPPNSNDDLEIIADLADGLLVTGGDDLAPSLYNELPHPKTECSQYDLDLLDIKLIKYFHKFNRPILGICRGIQSINVAYGGTLYQDLPSEYPQCRPQTHTQSDKNKNFEHLIQTLPNTYARSLFGTNYGVNSFHHQAIKEVGKGLIVSAVSEDGVIEAIEADQLFAVQWHPERINDDDIQFKIFTDFINMCK